MNFIIDNKTFFKVSKISQVKTYTKRLGDYKISSGEVKGKIFVDIDYYNSSMEQNFTTCTLDFNVLIPQELKVTNVMLRDLTVEVIDNQGFNCNYSLDLEANDDEIVEDEKPLNNEVQNDKTLEIIVEDDNVEATTNQENSSEKNIAVGKEENTANEDIKQEIQEQYDEMLSETLENRDNKRIEILTTTDDSDERGFLRFFDSFPTTYSLTRTLYVSNESKLNEISLKYNIPLEELYKGYDEKRHTVVIKDESK